MWSHNIVYLIELCIARDDSFRQFVVSAAPLTQYAVQFRYPSSEPDPTADHSREALAVAREVFQFVLDRLPAQTHPEPRTG